MSNVRGSDGPLDADTYRFAAEVREMGASGVRDAQEAARRAGVPNVYSINGVLHWELPDGSLTTEDPWKDGPPTDQGETEAS